MFYNETNDVSFVTHNSPFETLKSKASPLLN